MFDKIWYNSLNSPLFSPPTWVFAPIWAFLYFLIIISFVLYFLKDKKNKGLGYFYFFTQLLFNFLWPFIFFKYKNILGGLIIIILLDIFLILTIKRFFKVSLLSVWLLLPYLFWMIFATYLNFGYFILNKFI